MASGMWDFLEHTTSKFEIQINRNSDTTYKEFSRLQSFYLFWDIILLRCIYSLIKSFFF